MRIVIDEEDAEKLMAIAKAVGRLIRLSP